MMIAQLFYWEQEPLFLIVHRQIEMVKLLHAFAQSYIKKYEEKTIRNAKYSILSTNKN